MHAHRPLARVFAAALAMAGLGGMYVAFSATPVLPSASDDLDPFLGETAWPDEAESAEAMARDIRDLVRAEHAATGVAVRDAHPKAHGCVAASFAVVEDLDPALAHGVFAPGATYDAVIRFSNGNSNPHRADIKGDARGMAIKLRGVAGPKLLPDEDDTQDFVLITHPVFFAADPARYRALIHRGASGNPLVVATAPFALGWKGLAIARAITSKTIASPLEARYWSTTPYQLGVGSDRLAVKYSARPCVSGTGEIPKDPDDDYLRDAMRDSLRAGDACFDFLVQQRAAGMSVEDPRYEWDEAAAPFVRVARITVPAQEFDTPEQNATCEALSFTPWHSLADHKPLGGVNRARRVVYATIAAERRALNGPSEPSM